MEETLEAGEKKPERTCFKRHENPDINGQPQEHETRGARGGKCVCCQTAWPITKRRVTAAALQPDIANAGCTFSENMEPCASAARPGSGRHAVRQATISRERGAGLSAEQKEGKPTVV